MSDSRLNIMGEVLEKVSDAVCIYDTHWRLVYLNHAAAHLLGYDKADLLGKIIWNEYPNLIDEIFYEQYHKAVCDNIDVHIETYSPKLGKWVESKACPLDEGLVVYIRNSYEKALEVKCEELLNNLKKILNLCPIGIMEVNCAGKLVNTNQAICDILFPSYTVENLVGQGSEFLKEQLAVEWELSPAYRAIQGEIIKDIPLTLRGRNILVSALPITNKDDTITGAILVAQDVTEYVNERLETEKLLVKVDRLNLVSEMAAGVAHEIRNPMTVIKGYLQIHNRKTAGKIKEDIEIILSELDRVESLITDFLSVARTKANKRTLISLNDILKSIIPLLEAETSKHGIRLETKYGENMAELLLDAKEIKQLILNLARNAIDALKGRGTLMIETEMKTNRGCLYISDNGCGIPDELKEKIFDPFFSTKDNGTGLGLSICASIAERHRGTIAVESVLGEGTRFSIEFPK